MINKKKVIPAEGSLYIQIQNRKIFQILFQEENGKSMIMY